MIEGLSSLSDLLRLYKIKEDIYLRAEDGPASPDFVQAVVELYSNIFEYQAQMICYLSQSASKRAFRGTFKLDDWEGLLKKVQTSDGKCTQYCSLSDREREKKFYDESSRMLQSVDIQRSIQNMLEASQAHRQQDRREDQEAELLETLASDYKSDKDSISARVPGTCEWFFEDERFLKWRDSKDSRLLWVSAGPGCGKSVLSRSLIDERRVCNNTMTSTVCYFFFKDGEKHRMRGANALSAILHQLFENTALVSYALPSARSYGKKLRDAFSELWGILIKCAHDSEAGEIICVVDALDECEKDARSQLLEKLVLIFAQEEALKSSSSKLKFLVTSRPYDDLEEKFQPLSGVSTYMRFDGDDKSQSISREINLVIDHETPRIARGFSDEDCKRLSDRLKGMNNRTYLWLFLTINIITGSRSKYSKLSSIESVLSDLPSTVSDAYERILFRSSDKFHAEILLQLIIAATRPLSLQEANIALTLATQKASCTSHKALDLWPLETFKSTVQNMCGLFVNVHDGKISLIHQTARDFLMKTNESHCTPSSGWQGCLHMATAHGTISQICLTYLNFDDFARMPQNDSRRYRQREDETYPLLEYAAINWAAHYAFQPSEVAKDTQKAAQKLCDTSLPQQSYWFEIYCESRHLPSDDWTSVGIASLLGLRDVVEGFLDEGANVNAQGRFCGNALTAASSEGHDQVVQILIGNRADVNAQDKMYGNALQAASLIGNSHVVQILLHNGADINARGGYCGTALQAASLRGNSHVVQILLDNGADINARGGYYGTALQAASFGRNSHVVQILLENGAEINARAGCCGTALQAAILEGDDQVVQNLFEDGAISTPEENTG